MEIAINILVDDAMPFWQACFLPFGKVSTFQAGDLHQVSGKCQNVQLDTLLPEVEYLLVRSTTKVRQDLVDKMPRLKFVGTATAGYDHIDSDYLKSKGIQWYAAGGCNAQAVTQYLICTLLQLASRDDFVISEKTACVVGHGNVGRKVATALQALGAKVCIYDPPQQARLQNATNNTKSKDSTTHYVDFDAAMTADIICLHAPFNSEPDYPTKHMIDASTLESLRAQQYLINAGRGEVIDNQALLSACKARGENMPTLVLDVWENEPHIMRELIDYLYIATPHIAGHTLEGKSRGTFMLHDALSELAQKDSVVSLDDYLPSFDVSLPTEVIDAFSALELGNWHDIQRSVKEIAEFTYDILNDDRVFRRHMAQSASIAKLRQAYPIRREFSALAIPAHNNNLQELMHDLGFIIPNDS